LFASGRFGPEPRTKTFLGFSGFAMAGLFSPFGCNASRFSIGQVAFCRFF
jgi:hypothetical protein